MKRILCILCTLSILFTMNPAGVYGAQQEDAAMGSSMSKVKDEIVEAQDLIQDANDIINGKNTRSTVPEEPDDSIGIGVDISKWNWGPYSGKDVDFTALSGEVDYVIIRCGYGSDDEAQDDAYFEKSVKACEENAIPYGVYLYSHATTKEMAVSEANHTLRMINKAGAKPELPIFLDIEAPEHMKMSSYALTAMAKTYCTLIEKEGYHAGIYSSISLWNDKLTDPYFDQIVRWVARYNSYCGYKKDYAMWQCTPAAKVEGITGYVDYNYMIDDLFLLEDQPCSIESDSIEISKIEDQILDGEECCPEVKILRNGEALKEGTDYEVSYDDNDKEGEGTVIICGKGHYRGTVTKTFAIVQGEDKKKDTEVSAQEKISGYERALKFIKRILK